MKSFDFFDTLVTRLVARPGDLFMAVEQRLPLAGFAALRVQAEREARRRQPGREITLDDVYDRLPLPPAQRAAARQEELRLEQALSAPVPARLAGLGPQDLIVSDIYLPAPVLARLLGQWTETRPARWWVSAEHGVRKAEGGLWNLVRQQHPQLTHHTGDNLHSDVVQPRRRGLQCEHERSTTLAPHESAWLRRLPAQLDGSLVAGCMRAARLAAVGRPGHTGPAALAEVFSGFFAPALTAFVDWVLTSAQARGIERICFLARDGQLPYRIAQQRAAALGCTAELAYVHGSRRSLHLPGFVDIDAAASWLLEDTPVLTLRDVIERAGLWPSDVLPIAADHGLQALDDPLDRAGREALRALVHDPRFIEALQHCSARHFPSARAYFEQAGLQRGAVALVDVGWNGRLQASLRQLLDKRRNAPPLSLHGYYFCLSRRPALHGDDTVQGFAWEAGRDPGRNDWDGFRAMIEAALEADHGTTLGYTMTPDGHASAVLGDTPAAADLAAIQSQQAAVVAYAQALTRAEAALGRRVQVPRDAVLAPLLDFLQRPQRHHAAAFAERTRCEGQVEGRADALVRQVPFGPQLLQRQALGFWPEGSTAASGHRWLLPVMAAAREWRRQQRTA